MVYNPLELNQNVSRAGCPKYFKSNVKIEDNIVLDAFPCPKHGIIHSFNHSISVHRKVCFDICFGF